VRHIIFFLTIKENPIMISSGMLLLKTLEVEIKDLVVLILLLSLIFSKIFLETLEVVGLQEELVIEGMI
jgi:hypothetical protein